MSTNDPPGPDPDGGDDYAERRSSISSTATNPASTRSQIADMDDLAERFSQQQVMISQLKEMAMAEEAARNQKIASSRLKMEKCVSQLAKIRNRAKGSRLRNTSDTPDTSARSQSSVEPAVTSDYIPQTSSSIVTMTTTTLTSTSVTATTVPNVPSQTIEPSNKLRTPRREVTKLLHQQIQGHKAKIAKTAQHEKELEEALAKIQKQLEENQNQSAELLQVGQTKPKLTLPAHIFDDTSESNKIISELKTKITQLEGTILDLQETCKEKDSVIDSKTKAITLMSADLSMKGKNTLDLLDDTKEQMQQMQQNFATMESQMNDEKQKLADELETCKNRIFYLEEANAILETERFNLSVQNSFLEEQLAEKEKEINRMTEEMVENMRNIEQLTQKVDKSVETSVAHEEKGSMEISQMNALSEKIEILEKLNLALRQSNIELQEKISPSSTAATKETAKPTIRDESPKPSRKNKTPAKSKGSQKYKNLNPKLETAAKETPSSSTSNKDLQETVDRLQIIIETLNKQVLEKEVLLSQKETENKEIKETALESSMEPSNDSSLQKSDFSDVSESIEEKSLSNVESEPVTDSDLDGTKVKRIEVQLEDALHEIEKLNSQLVDANKSMIKVKAAHKKELKQLQKSIDDFSKVSDSNTELIKLQSEVFLLSQKVAELEEEKGNLQLHLVDYDSGRVSDSQLHAKLMEMENLAEERLKAIAELETQKFDLVQELHSVKQEIISLEDKVADLSFLENEHVSAELKSAQLEEQLDVLNNKNAETRKEIEQLKEEKEELLATVDSMNKEKIDLNNKLEMYIQENMDLIEKLDKLSAEKVSSAESIEMVESLTSQEKMEIENYQKGIEDSHMDKPKSREEVEESLRRSSFSHSSNIESTDVQSNIDIINQERHEFMEKLDSLKVENSSLSLRLEELLNENKILEDRQQVLQDESYKSALALTEENNQAANLLKELESLKQEKNLISSQLEVLSEEKLSLKDRIDSLEYESNKLSTVLNEESTHKSSLLSEIDSLKSENANLLDKIKTLSAGKEVKTQELVISETVIEDFTEKEVIQTSVHQDESLPAESSGKPASKSNKNQTKEILRLKNVIKQKEEDIENLKLEISQLKENIPDDKSSQLQSITDELDRALQDNKMLNDEMTQLRNEKDLCSQRLQDIENTIQEESMDKQKISELAIEKENVIRGLESKILSDEKIIAALRNTVEQHKNDMEMLNSIMQNKDDEITQYKEDIEQLDAVSRKLKSTLTQMEEEKSSSIFNEDKIKELENSLNQSKNIIEEGKATIRQLESKIEETLEQTEMLKTEIAQSEAKIIERNSEIENIKLEINKVNTEKNEIVKEVVKWQKDCAIKDEEINEIKLQFRRESIVHDEVISNLKNSEEANAQLKEKIVLLEKACDDYKSEASKLREESEGFDKKLKEQFDKYKKLAINFKKKYALCTELENQVESLKEEKQKYVAQLEEVTLKHQQTSQELSVVNSQFSVVQSQLLQSSSTNEIKETLEQQLTALGGQIQELQSQVESLQNQNDVLSAEKVQLTNDLLETRNKTCALSEENSLLLDKIQSLNEELELKIREMSKFSDLDQELQEKHTTITNLQTSIEEAKDFYNQLKCGQEAKLQEKDIYIESLESEIMKYKDRILRLEDSVSTMEERRASLERKTDNLVTKLHEKDAQCSESSIHGDELEKRVAALIDHDDLIQKQLEDTQQENLELLEKLNELSRSNNAMRSELDNARVELSTLRNDLAQLHTLQEENLSFGEKVSFLESELKRVSMESTELIKQKAKEYEYLESELHSLMSNTEIQRRLSKERIDKLQDEMSLQSQMVKELQEENEWLKAENETINLKKVQLSKESEGVPNFDYSQFSISEPSKESEIKVKELNNLLSEKEKEISDLTKQLEAVSANNAPEINNSRIKELESVIIEKNEEITHIDSQFKSCLNQLSEVIESEKALKLNVTELTKEIDSQIQMVQRLENEIALLNATKEQYSSGEPISEPVCQVNVALGVTAKVPDTTPKASAASSENLDPSAFKFLEDQIISADHPEKLTLTDSEKKMIRHFEHDPPEPVSMELKSYFHSSRPTEEEFIQPKKAFVCYQERTTQFSPQPISENVFDEEDGWGWGNQETTDDHQTQSVSNNNQKIIELENLIQQLTEEKTKLSADLTQSQQKTTKALLKLKEFKNKNEALTNQVKSLKMTSDFNMLDMTIQDELASQIKTLEEKLKEVAGEQSKEKSEKENLLKRIDVLTAANERLMEMKEKQDIEMQICRNQNKGLNEKIKNLDWNNSFNVEEDPPETTVQQVEEMETVSEPQDVSNVKDIIELIKKVQDLEADNEELQALIEERQTKITELKNVEIEFEKIKNQITFEVSQLSEENTLLKRNVDDLTQKCKELEFSVDQMNVDSNRKSEFESEILNLRESLNKLTLELKQKDVEVTNCDAMKSENLEMQNKLLELNSSYNLLLAEVQSLKDLNSSQLSQFQLENAALKHEIETTVQNLEGLQNNYTLLSEENLKLKEEAMVNRDINSQQNEMEVVDLRSKLEALVKEYFEFQEKFNEMASEKDNIEIKYTNLMAEKEKLDALYKDVSEQEAASKTELIKISYEKDEIAEKYEKILNKLSEKNLNEQTEQTIALTDKLSNLNEELNLKNSEIIELNNKIEQYQVTHNSYQESFLKLQDENKLLVDSLNALHNSVNDAVDKRGMEVAEIWKDHLAQREAEFMSVEQALRNELLALQSMQSESLQTTESKNVQPLSALNNEEFITIKRQLEESNQLKVKLANDLGEMKQFLESVTSEKDEAKQFYENRIEILVKDYNEIQKCLENEKNQNHSHSLKIAELNNELESLKSLHHSVQLDSEENVKRVDHNNAIISAKEKELQEQLARVQLMTETFNFKINDYEMSLSHKETELDNVRQQLYASENKLSESIHEHEAELADMRLKLHAERTQYDQIILELKANVERLELQLETKINECLSLNQRIETMIQEDNARLNELKKALESQEIEIVTLKENLTEQADTYEKLVISHMQEINKLKANRHVTFSEETKPGAEIEEPSTSVEAKDENSTRAELDLALYMLHQRDVRCEELTMELTQLLEERDTLQLKLSNALRAYEEIRSKNVGDRRQSEGCEEAIEAVKLIPVLETPNVAEKQLPVVDPAAVATSSEATPATLESRISQLHKVGHMRDIRLRDEREHRMRQMELLQRDLQHLPPEAAARLREAHYTLTRDTQSASTVLLNWLWGKTTPKVIDM